MVWGLVLAVGLGFGLSQVTPVPAIILAQALNGIILPVVAIGLLILVNNPELMSSGTINTAMVNILMSAVVFVTVVIGVQNVAGALNRMLPIQLVDEANILSISAVLSVLLSWPVYGMITRIRKSEA